MTMVGKGTPEGHTGWAEGEGMARRDCSSLGWQEAKAVEQSPQVGRDAHAACRGCWAALRAWRQWALSSTRSWLRAPRALGRVPRPLP